MIQEVVQNPGILQEYFQNAMPELISFLIQLVIAIVILLIGSKIIKMITKMLRRSLERGSAEAGVISFVCSLTKYV